jgi:asparagine synthase (glutamine-hydrolysing)
MCGIFGVLLAGTSHTPERAKLVESTQLLRHRGPDASCVHCEPGLGLGHTRLSFVDVDARSNQPFWDRTRRYALVFNGEIYNFRQIRAQLEGEGVKFRTTSDTEVLLEILLRKDASDALNALEGMFAFALYDSRERTLLLARDRFGMKPLFVYEDDGRFLFASETKAMKPWLDLRADNFMVSAYLLNFRGPTSGHTFLDGVISLAPGQMMIKRAGQRSETTTFARLEGFMTPDALQHYASKSPREMTDHLDELLTASVDAHLLADVPVGAFCSGGVDSSLLMAIAARKHNNLAIFHANVKGRWSEFDAASALARHLKLEINSVEVEEQDFVDGLPRAIAHFEQPIADRPNCVPMMRVAELARDTGVKGLLSGEGSDECFLGYPWLGRKRLTDAYYAAGESLRSLVRKLPGIGDILSPQVDGSGSIARELLSRSEIADDNQRVRSTVLSMEAHATSIHHTWTLEYLHHHLRILLHRNDTMGMAGSIESRFPFLDHKVVQAAINMPGDLKLRRDFTAFDKAHPFFRDKWIVRQVANRYMPTALSQRNKFGFWTTVFDRMRIDPQYFHNSWFGDLVGITNRQLATLLDTSKPKFHLRLLHLDMWGRMCIEGQQEDKNIALIRRFVRILPE